MQVTFKGQQCEVYLHHPRLCEPKDAYTDSQVDSAVWANGRELTEAEIEELTDQLRADGSLHRTRRRSLRSHDGSLTKEIA